MILLLALFAHANVADTPPGWYAFFFTTLPAHASHHRLGFHETRCNYANALILWDRVFGTFQAGEPAPDDLGQGTQRRLGILQQWAYPFRAPARVEEPVRWSR
jgi:sterol desaturase/sphingolipid hydroxylase (fatty acid hydroxylase superfamily)